MTADLQYVFDTFWEFLVRLGDRFIPYLNATGMVSTIAGVLLISRRFYGFRLVRDHPGIFHGHPVLQRLLTTLNSSGLEDSIGLCAGVVLLLLGVIGGLRWFLKRGLI